MKHSVAISEELYIRISEIAASGHLSVDEFVSSLLHDQLAAREFIESRAKLFTREDFDKALNQIPDVDPEEYDRL